MRQKYIKNGYGLVTPEGFSVFDRTGYVIRNTNYGCFPAWPGFFADLFRFSAVTGGGTDQPFGPTWLYRPSSLGSGATATATGNGYVTCQGICIGGVANGGEVWFRPSCSSFEQIGAQSSQIRWNSFNTWTFLEDIIVTEPLGTGGAMAMLYVDGANWHGYRVEAKNESIFIGGPNIWMRYMMVRTQVMCRRAAIFGVYTLAESVRFFTDWDAGLGRLGWTAVPHILKITVTPQGGSTHRVQSYIDGIEVANVLNSELGQQVGWFGFWGGGTVDAACLDIQTSKLDRFVGTQL